MKAITCHQPWASLIAEGVKSIETRPKRAPWSSAIGETIAIHAATRWPEMMHLPPITHDGTWEEQDAHNHQTWHVCKTITDPAYMGPRPVNPKTGRTSRVPLRAQAPTLFWPHAGPHADVNEKGHSRTMHLPLGAVVATCRIADVLPIGDRWGVAHERASKGVRGRALMRRDHKIFGGETDGLWIISSDGGRGDVDGYAEDQFPFGDFTISYPYRWALLLDNVVKLDEPIYKVGGHHRGLWTVPDDVANTLSKAA